MKEVVSQVKEQNVQLFQDNQQLSKDNQQLSMENKDLSSELEDLIKSSQNVQLSLDNQRERYEKRHKSILQTKLLEQNTKFNDILQTYFKEITRLQLLLKSKPPDVSPVDYKTHGLDLRKTTSLSVPLEVSEISPSISHYRDKLRRLREAGGLSNND